MGEEWWLGGTGQSPRHIRPTPGVGQEQQQIGMAGERRAPTDEIVPAERAQPVRPLLLRHAPHLVTKFFDHRGSVSVHTDAIRIAPW